MRYYKRPIQKPFASDKLRRLEEDEKHIKKYYGHQYYENKHRQYQREADFDGMMICISLTLVLMFFAFCFNNY